MRYEVKNELSGITIAQFLPESDCKIYINALKAILPVYAKDLKVNEIKIDILK